MFNFSANHLTLLSRTEYRSCAVFLVLDHSTRRVYRLHDFTKAHALEPGSYLLRFGQSQQRRQTLSGDRIGQAGCQAQPVFHCSMLLLTARKDHPDGLIQTGREKTRPVHGCRSYPRLTPSCPREPKPVTAWLPSNR